MKKYLYLCILICSVCFAGNFVLDDFSGISNCSWAACKWGQRPNAFYKVKDGVLTLHYAGPEEKVKGGFSFSAGLKGSCDLASYKYLSFRAKSATTKGCTIQVYIRREIPSGKFSSFYSIVRLTPEWKCYDLCLKNAERSQANKGFFVKTKADAGASRQLSTGGKLESISFYTKTAEAVMIDKMELKSSLSNDGEKDKEIVEAIKTYKKYVPYAFQKILGANGPLLVKDGKSSFAIYVNKEIGATGDFAATQMVYYIEKSTGAKIAIVDKVAPGQNILELSIKRDRSHPDGFKTEAQNSHQILICGNDPRGLLYGVYDFLEKALGIRWFAPFDYAEIIPPQTTVKLPLWQDESFPGMIYRRFHYCSAGRGVPEPMKHRYIAADWCVKNRYNVELERLVSSWDTPAVKKERLDKIKNFYSKRGGVIALPTMWGHNYHYWVPPEKYFKSNPEYFCLDRSTGKWRAERAQLCCTNPDVVKIIVERAVEYFKEYPEREYFPLFQEDGSRLWCQCPKCRALYKNTDINSYKTEHSLNLANMVAAELSKKIPGKKVVTYAYDVTTQPPVNIMPREDVFVTYCLMDFSNPKKAAWEEYSGKELAVWNKLCKGNLILYTYNYLDFYYTASTSESLVRTFRYFDLLKIKCSCQESNENWYGVSAYHYYLSARLAWNPWFDIEQFQKDYYEKFYGKAADYIAQYQDVMGNCLANKEYWLEYGNKTYPYIPTEKINAMNACLEKAKAISKGDSRLINAVNAQCRGFQYVKAFSNAVVAGAEFQKKLTEEDYQRAIKCLAELDHIIKELTPERLVPVRALNQTEAMRRNMRENYMRNNAFKAVNKTYKVVKEITDSWNFKIDSKNEGEKKKWFAKDFDTSKWEKIKAGNWWGKQGFGKYLGTAWYHIKLDIPSYKNNMALYFCGVDERAWVYLDGKYIGGHYEGEVSKLWNEPFLIELSPNITSGKHQLTVKVHASAGQGGLWRPVFLLDKK